MRIFVSAFILKEIGGVSTALVNMLNEISKRHDVTLCVLTNYIKPKEPLNRRIKIVKGSKYLYYTMLPRTSLNHQKLITRFLWICLRIWRILIGHKNMLKLGFKEIGKQTGYDVAIAFWNNDYKKGRIVYGGDLDYIDTNVEAKYKMAWIHSEANQIGLDSPKLRHIFDNMDAIIHVSEDGKRIFDSIFPNIANRSHVIYNVYNIETIQRLATLERPYKDNKKINFVTVGRLHNISKRIDRILNVCKKLSDEGITMFEWHIIGDGGDKKMYETMIESLKIGDIVFLDGLKENPYPYIFYADALVLSSAYEGLPMVVKEAHILGCPTLVTAFGSAHEAVAEGINGIICENSTEGLFQMMISVLTDPSILVNLRKELKLHPVSNEDSLNRFENLCTKKICK